MKIAAIFLATAVTCLQAQADTYLTPSGTVSVSTAGSTTYVLSAGTTPGVSTAPVVVSPTTGSNLPSTVVTNSGTYVVVPNYATGGTMAVIQTSRGKR